MTTWIYDPYRGFLTNKTDAVSKAVSYTYTAAGRLASRLWARGTNTSYSYNTAGDLATVIYSDGTAGVTNTYDRLGRKSSVLCGSTTTSFTYDWANDVLGETNSGGVLNGLMVTNQFDTDLRRTNMALLNSGTPLNKAIYGYDNASRLASVSDGTNSAAYSYLANSPLVGQIAFAHSGTTEMTTSKQYDYLNRLSSIASSPTSAFTYQYNSVNQRTLNQMWDGSYWQYGYDALGQVISGNKKWADGTPVAGQQFGYTFDTIGNRTQTQAGGDQMGANLRVANYTNNTLNQITNRDVPGYVNIMGDTLATNTVSVNGQVAYQKAEYFRKQLNVTNTSVAVWDGVTVSAPGQGSVTGLVYVAKTPESFTYDADGNLTNDGRWTYAWDAENRLVNITSQTSAPSGSKLQLAFAYDYMGRRMQKIVSTNNGSSYVGEYTNNYAYDGWNCIAVLNPSLSLVDSFMWGSDLSGRIQGAGGVGGLIEMSYYGTSTTNCFVAFDGNGNVNALVNAANGTTLANYEYGPFGELIRASGPMAKLNPFRFSTKYDDDESDFLYYGYRYYNPSIGGWLSRDPMEENGGINLYVIDDNDDINKTDSYGLWHYVLPPNIRFFDKRALVEADQTNDPYSDLAALVHLDPNEVKKWLDDWVPNNQVTPCDQFTVPNTVYLNRTINWTFWTTWTGNERDAVQAQGYHVTYRTAVNNDTIVQEFADPDIWGFINVAHADSGHPGEIETDDARGLRPNDPGAVPVHKLGGFKLVQCYGTLMWRPIVAPQGYYWFNPNSTYVFFTPHGFY